MKRLATNVLPSSLVLQWTPRKVSAVLMLEPSESSGYHRTRGHQSWIGTACTEASKNFTSARIHMGAACTETSRCSRWESVHLQKYMSFPCQFTFLQRGANCLSEPLAMCLEVAPKYLAFGCCLRTTLQNCEAVCSNVPALTV